ncbi:hypothetical protein [Streptomyces sp. NPDC059063]|uniref:hypothetical protein n=1 Tax=unclassified Streptomyces TaxID=2593676 RepID=UPI0036B3DB09
MTRDGVTSEPTPPVLGICGHQTTAPVPVGEVQKQSGGAWFTHVVCPDCVHRYGPLAQWDELPGMRWITQR